MVVAARSIRMTVLKSTQQTCWNGSSTEIMRSSVQLDKSWNSLQRLVEPKAIEPLIQVADTGSQKRTQLTIMPSPNCLSRCPDVRSPFSLFIRQKPASFQDFPIRS